MGDCTSMSPLTPDPCVSERDPDNNVIRIKTTHFSTYAIKSMSVFPPAVPGLSGAGLLVLAILLAIAVGFATVRPSARRRSA